MLLLLFDVFGVKGIIVECCIDDICGICGKWVGSRMIFGDTMEKVV